MTAPGTAAPAMTGPRIVRTYMVLAGMYTFAASLIWSVNTLFLLDAGLEISEVFVVNALFSVGMVAFEIPTGVVADTLGRRLSYLLSVAVLAVTTVLYVVAGQAGAGWLVFGAISILMGLGFTFFSGALEAWLVDGLNSVAAEGDGPPDLDHVFARGQQVSGASMFVGTILGGFLGQWNLSVPYVARAVVLVLVFVVAARLMVEVGFTPQRLKLAEVPRQMREQARVGIAYGWDHRGLRLLMISGGIRGVFFGWAFYAAQPYFLELLGRDAIWVVGLVTAGVSLATIAGNQLVDVFSRRCGRRTTLLISASAVSTVAAVTIGLTSSFAVAVAALLVVAGAMGVMMPVRQSYLHHVTTSEHRATIVSFDAMVVSIGGAGGQVGLGAVADNRSFSAGYVVGGLFTGLAVPVLFALRRLGGPADQIIGADAGVDGTCPAGLPRDTGVESLPVPAVIDR
ncbi:MAG: MFS transporter [Acidimicrobiia bacterium]|nr:MFS transporter [Acidimicrobiia bacterium]